MDHLPNDDILYPKDTISILTDDQIYEFISQHHWPFGPLENVPSNHGKYQGKKIEELLFMLLKRAQTKKKSTLIEVVISLNF